MQPILKTRLANYSTALFWKALLLLCVLVCQPLKADTITVMGEFHPPLNGNPDDAEPGFMIEIAEAIFSKHGHTIEYTLGPRPRAVMMARMGEVDCVVNAKIKSHNFLEFPEQPWGYHAATLFALPSSAYQYQGIDQLQHVTLGAIAGMGYDNGPLDAYLQEKTDKVVMSYGEYAMDKQMKMLFHKRIETIVSCPLVMRGHLKTMGISLGRIKNVGEVKPFVGMYFACGSNRRTLEYIRLINETLPELRQSGELQAILDKYGQIDWLDIYNALNQPH